MAKSTDQKTLDQVGESVARQKRDAYWDKAYGDIQKEKEVNRRVDEAAQQIRKEVFTKDNQPAGELKKNNND